MGNSSRCVAYQFSMEEATQRVRNAATLPILLDFFDDSDSAYTHPYAGAFAYCAAFYFSTRRLGLESTRFQ